MAAHTLALLLLFLFGQSRQAHAGNDHRCPPSSCGKIQNITFPFRLKTDPKRCGDNKHTLSCENNMTILYLLPGRYTVESISYANQTIRITDPDVRSHNCSSRPRHSISSFDFGYDNPAFQVQWPNQTVASSVPLTKHVIFMNCGSPVDSPLYIDAKSCADKKFTYVLVDEDLTVADMPESCAVELICLVSSDAKINGTNVSFADIHGALVDGIELAWIVMDIYPNDAWHKFTSFMHYFFEEDQTYLFVMTMTAIALVARCILCSPFVAAFLIRKWRRRHLSVDSRIEEFLQSHNNLSPIRYSYSEIKKMSKGFREKLGQGGYGSVYKGELRSGHSVAIKTLTSSKADSGEDFMNEVSTIGRIHHVNVVRLIGFCVEGSKRALVYDFMPEGSLDRHIFSGEGVERLSSEKMFEIALGVARGIEYLHRGCEMQILHFDIKPHNILLDENFCPKVSDFGLARLCPLDGNTLSLTAARGTLGYIAPELFYKNIGGVSYKADVYSFGMLLMEMASRRKNLNSRTESSSKVHFPSWISNRFSEGSEVDLGVETEEEMEIVKKMMVVALWCIQFKPCDRPSMSKVVEMLEKTKDGLQLPPTKFSFYPHEERPFEDVGETSLPWPSSVLSEDTSIDTIAPSPNTNLDTTPLLC